MKTSDVRKKLAKLSAKIKYNDTGRLKRPGKAWPKKTKRKLIKY